MAAHVTLPSTIAPLPDVTEDSKATTTILLSEPLSPIAELDELGELMSGGRDENIAMFLSKQDSFIEINTQKAI